MVGKSESSDFPLLNAGGTSYFQTNGGINNSNAYVVKFSNTGVRLWATSLGGSLIDEALSVIADHNGDIIITGKTFSNNFPLMNPGGGAYFQGTFGGVIDIFMARFTNTGNQLWTTYFGGTSGENQGWYDNLAIDSCGNVYMTLSSAINDIPLLAQCEGGFIDSLFNGSDVILVKFSSTNEILWSTFIGGNGLDFQGALAVDNNKNVFLSGEWCGTSVNNASYPLVNAGGGTYFDGTFNGGGDDGFVLKFAPTIPIINTNILQPTCANLCAGEAAVSITGSCNYSYLWSNGQTQQTATGLCPGNYTVQITNPICGGLDTLIQVTIVAPPSSITPSFAAFGNFCAGDTMQALPTTSINNVTGIWSPALNNTVTTTYTFTPNAGQCALDTQLTIQVNPLPVVNAFTNNVFCENQTLQLSVNATVGASYIWQGPNAFTSIQQNNSIPNITSANSGSYIVNVNLNSCINSDTININVIAPTFFNQSIQLCNGQSYQLPDGSFTDSAGVYNHLFLGVNGCDSIINTIVILVNAVQSNISAQICTGQSYLLPDSNVVFNTGLYVVTIPSIAGCDSIIQINLIAGNTSVDSLSIQLCQGQNYTLPDGNIANTAGVFPVVLQNQFGCDSIIVTSINVLQNIIPSLEINAIPNNIICAGSPVLFTSTFYNIGVNPIYQWFINGIALPGEANDSLNISSLQNNDTISLAIISSLNCNDSNIVYSNNIVISVISAPDYLLHISCSDSILCALQKATFTASVSNGSSNIIYKWYINNILLQESNDSTFSYSNFNDGDSIICSIVTPIVCNGISQIYSNAIVI